MHEHITGVYRCEYCHAVFFNLIDKNEHIKRFHKNSKAPCDILRKDFKQSELWEFEV